MGTFVPVAKAAQLKENEGTVVLVNDEEIALFKVGEQVCAVTNVCPHRGGPIGEGYLDGKIVTCPWHGWEFDVTTGAMPVNPAIGIKTYPARVEGEEVLVEMNGTHG